MLRRPLTAFDIQDSDIELMEKQIKEKLAQIAAIKQEEAQKTFMPMDNEHPQPLMELTPSSGLAVSLQDDVNQPGPSSRVNFATPTQGNKDSEMSSSDNAIITSMPLPEDYPMQSYSTPQAPAQMSFGRGRGFRGGGFRGQNSRGGRYFQNRQRDDGKDGNFYRKRSSNFEEAYGYNSGKSEPTNKRTKFEDPDEEMVDQGKPDIDKEIRNLKIENRRKLSNEVKNKKPVEVKKGEMESSDEDDGKDEKPSKRLKMKDIHRDAKYKAFRIVIRNLAWTIAEKPGTCAGYCFVQFKSKESAEAAREHFNNNKFLGRSVAADYALPKDTFVTMVHEEKEMLKNKVKVEKEEPNLSKKTEEKSPVKVEAKDGKESESDAEMDEENEDEESDLENEDEEDSEPEQKPKKQNKTDKAIEEERVIFLRGLSFDTTNEVLKEEMSKFGTAQLALICVFKDSGHPKGTGFVHFSSNEEAKKCIKKSEERELIIDGQTITAALALPREKAEEMEKERLKKIPKDNRNLRLLRFGVIREGTAAAKGMSEGDAAKRKQLTLAAKKKLENLTMFVSPLRLMVHNLPQKVDDAKLRQICQNAAGGKAEISECRVWKDKDRLDKSEQRKAKSKGVEVPVKALSDKIKQQVRQSIGQMHSAGMKFLPKFVGKKLRHRNLTGKKKKQVEAKKKAKAAKHGKPLPPPQKKKTAKSIKKPTKSEANKQVKKRNKKSVTKYLTLSG
ncbi:hypothetical protein WR25_09090 [Diploscapter pachys]|uniref:RRM domain-containing protein n=1 Tax=Diploscapter pachys TaxID=2018661 RepID=A0A2A2LPA2_9BILA|nr:hypothetical protein WR25_09090 [Diploscapter pachys]